jgi:hypothetical protein
MSFFWSEREQRVKSVLKKVEKKINIYFFKYQLFLIYNEFRDKNYLKRN